MWVTLTLYKEKQGNSKGHSHLSRLEEYPESGPLQKLLASPESLGVCKYWYWAVIGQESYCPADETQPHSLLRSGNLGLALRFLILKPCFTSHFPCGELSSDSNTPSEMFPFPGALVSLLSQHPVEVLKRTLSPQPSKPSLCPSRGNVDKLTYSPDGLSQCQTAQLTWWLVWLRSVSLSVIREESQLCIADLLHSTCFPTDPSGGC